MFILKCKYVYSNFDLIIHRCYRLGVENIPTTINLVIQIYSFKDVHPPTPNDYIESAIASALSCHSSLPTVNFAINARTVSSS